MKIKLSVNNIKDLKDTITFVVSNLDDVTCGKIVDDVSDIGIMLAKKLDDVAPETKSERTFIKDDVDTSKKAFATGKITMNGKDAVYSEFGTGEYGKEQHILEPTDFGLRGFNTGKTIKVHGEDSSKAGRHYWFYHGTATKWIQPNGYTEGMPAGLQMYNTAKSLRDGAFVKQRINKTIEDSIKKLY